MVDFKDGFITKCKAEECQLEYTVTQFFMHVYSHITVIEALTV